MKKYLLYSLLLFAAASGRANWKPSDVFLDAVCQVESSGGRFLVGDRGHSLGHFQIQRDAWVDISAWRQRQELPLHRYGENALNPKINRLYAANYMTMLRDRLNQIYGREPSASEIYAAYNMGMTHFRKCNYRLSEVNPVTLLKCNAVVTLMQQPLLSSR